MHASVGRHHVVGGCVALVVDYVKHSSFCAL